MVVTDLQRLLGEHLCRLAGWDDSGPKCYCNCVCCMGHCEAAPHTLRNHIPGFCPYPLEQLAAEGATSPVHFNANYRPRHRPQFVVQDFGPDDEEEEGEASNATYPPANPRPEADTTPYPNRAPYPREETHEPPSGSDTQAASTAEEGAATGEHESLAEETHDGQDGTAPDDGTEAHRTPPADATATNETPAQTTVKAPPLTITADGIDNRPKPKTTPKGGQSGS